MEGSQWVHLGGCLKPLLEVCHHACHNPKAEVQVWPALEYETCICTEVTVPSWLSTARSDRCPHCQQPDSGRHMLHMLGGCGHRVMKSLYISRHDGAMRKILKAINHGKHGSFLKIADISKDELRNDLAVVSKRIPGWLISDATLLECDLPVERRHVLHPEVLLSLEDRSKAEQQ